MSLISTREKLCETWKKFTRAESEAVRYRTVKYGQEPSSEARYMTVKYGPMKPSGKNGKNPEAIN